MSRTLGIHWAATTHGTWLHGDVRGSWLKGRLIGPDPSLEFACRDSLNETSVVLTDAEQRLVADEFGKIVRDHRVSVFAATIQATHVHLILAPLRENIKTVIARFKYRSAAAVLAKRPAETAGLYSRAVSARRSLWTAGKFPVFMFDEHHLINAIEYVRDHNRRGGLVADPFDWIQPLFLAGKVTGERMMRSTVCEVPRC
jgi:REP element-mobilizing transposase RayT